ncbi:isoleucine--tRNA ligase, cytoplasmic [Bacillus rossius redtenbacheri]|uniref:isoleucine--tRNA ligase, cytoplasmic n=1 Tax=Bacillus rossius redtenbacheri TaxID=93214 RepID=UPI002FDCC71D
MMQSVPENINFSQEEEKILELWKQWDVLKTCLKQSKGKPRYTFYDGPPFATGLPHYGHVLAGTVKDIVTRYAHQQGFHVERRFGWDCHGLPVEFEIDTALGIKGPQDVAAMGIDKYNSECRKIVMRYANEWEMIIGRLGRWIDFKNDYKTLYPWYMESIWWVFSQLFLKGLVYQGVKVMPFSTSCNTPLSNFEAGLNYKEVVDPAVIVGFPLLEDSNVFLIAWTTTPWTLPSNLALCVNGNSDYVKVKDSKTGKLFILMEVRLGILYTKEDQYSVIDKFKGIYLKGKKYKPLFPYFENYASKGAFEVLVDSYVTEDAGTGIVHQAPYFGEDDHRVALAAGIITRDQKMICPLDECGCFTEPVTDFLGQYIKDADKNIIKYLKDKDLLVNSSTTKHSYPFCWRSETPLIYRAIPSWFIRVQQMCDDLLRNSQSTHWVPEFVKEKRFGNWLRDARDWAVSRNRYWGTPIPLWVSEDGEEVVVVGSIAELEQLTGQLVKDLHRESIDHLTIPSARPGKPPLKRVPEVFDCWFESGSMPYAQLHYPFEHRKDFEDYFPADFIAEGIDQTRGWFYTLLVISTALFNKPPFKNLIAHGLVLAGDGQKMSKRKKNYPDPVEVVTKYGADALRLYLINSPVVRAENLRFKEEGVRDLLKDVFLPWYNAYRFLAQNLTQKLKEGMQFTFDEAVAVKDVSENVMDRWILSFIQSLLLFVKTEMAAYRLYTVVPKLVKFIDHLTNWYVRMNRKRLKGEGGPDDCRNALTTLFHVLFAMVRTMAPFTPFITELMYQNLKHLVVYHDSKETTTSVHYLMLPEPSISLIDEDIERAVSRMQSVIELGRVIRDRKTIPIKYPLPEVVVIHEDEQCLKDIRSLEKYILDELNVRKVTLTKEKQKYGVCLRAEPDHKTLGARLKGEFKAVTAGVKALSDRDVQTFLSQGFIDVLGHRLEPADLRIMYSFTGAAAEDLAQRYEAHSNDFLIMMDVTPDDTMQDEGIARELINRVQKLRKKAHLVPSDEVTAYYSISPRDGQLERVAVSHASFIENVVKGPWRRCEDQPARSLIIAEETQVVKGNELKLVLVKGFPSDYVSCNPGKRQVEPFCRYVNIQLCENLQPRYGAKGRMATVLLENPVGENLLSLSQLQKEAEVVFGLYGQNFELQHGDGKSELKNQLDIDSLHKKTVLIAKIGEENRIKPSQDVPSSKFVNVDCGRKKATLLLENPAGDFSLESDVVAVTKLLGRVYGVPAKCVDLGTMSTNGHKFEVTDEPLVFEIK